MLKFGIKPKQINFVPEPTEREVFDKEIKELRTVLTAEVRQEVKEEKSAATPAVSSDSIASTLKTEKPSADELSVKSEPRDQDDL